GPHRALVADAGIQGDQFELLSVVTVIDARHENRGGLLAELAGDIADPDLLVGLAGGAVMARDILFGIFVPRPDARAVSCVGGGFGDSLEDEGLHDPLAAPH